MTSLTVLGSTGSIGTQTLDLARFHGWDIKALVAGRNADLLTSQMREFQPELVVCDPSVVALAQANAPSGTRVASGHAALKDASQTPVDTVVAAIPGMAGLQPVRHALEAGQHVALATKEAMVTAGPLIHELIERHGGRLTPVDSEHAGVDQLLVGEPRDRVDTVFLTASGGPFRTFEGDLSMVKPEQALNHPTWSMGPKVTIDSATLFNKGLELIEAVHLFQFAVDQVQVVVHPQSLVHALVRFKDGSLKAHVGPHDMRIAIAWGVAGLSRPRTPVEPFEPLGSWEFEAPDLERFPALRLAREAAEAGRTAPATMNAADEVAVPMFLDGRLTFDRIPSVIEATMEHAARHELSWDSIHEADQEARRLATSTATRWMQQ
jgi:1-deoxy-D-xylulose-5-phosphate reductoisomerase